jgi:hypothetical protein
VVGGYDTAHCGRWFLTPLIVVGGYNITYPGRWIPTFREKKLPPAILHRASNLFRDVTLFIGEWFILKCRLCKPVYIGNISRFV